MQSKVAELGREIDQQKQQLTLKSDAMRNLDREKAEQAESLQRQISSLQERIDGLQSEKASLESDMNSVYYIAGTKDNLESQGKIKGTFLGLFGMKVGDISFADFQNKVDLRDKSAIELSAPDLGVKEIEKIGILPKYLRKGYDYQVETASDKQTAKIHFLNTDKFRIARIVVYIN
jgi:hypothetical protein